jgi:hypothetical protein
MQLDIVKRPFFQLEYSADVRDGAAPRKAGWTSLVHLFDRRNRRKRRGFFQAVILARDWSALHVLRRD